jgi:hypothetical protein
MVTERTIAFLFNGHLILTLFLDVCQGAQLGKSAGVTVEPALLRGMLRADCCFLIVNVMEYQSCNLFFRPKLIVATGVRDASSNACLTTA